MSESVLSSMWAEVRRHGRKSENCALTAGVSRRSRSDVSRTEAVCESVDVDATGLPVEIVPLFIGAMGEGWRGACVERPAGNTRMPRPTRHSPTISSIAVPLGSANELRWKRAK